MLRRMLDSLELTQYPYSPPTSQLAKLIQSDHNLGGSYKPLLSRQTSGSFEERYEFHQHKMRKVTESKDATSKTEEITETTTAGAIH